MGLLCFLYPAPASASDTKLEIFTVGDSTVQNWSPANYPKTGWGQVIHYFFNTNDVIFHNVAQGGASSKSYYDRYWTNVLKQVKAGDLVLIEFGINDMNSKPAIHTEPLTTYKDYLVRFVQETKVKEAYPIFVVPQQCNSLPHGSSWGLYPAAMRQVAQSLNVPLVDLDIASAALRNEAGADYLTQFVYMTFPAGEYTNYPTGSKDDTHLQEMGAIEMAKLVVQGLRQLKSDPKIDQLIQHLSPTYKVAFTADAARGLITRSGWFPAGVRITAKAVPNPGFNFAQWSGDLTGTNALTTFFMGTADKSIKADFISAAHAHQ